jgi:hypothetical protein
MRLNWTETVQTKQDNKIYFSMIFLYFYIFPLSSPVGESCWNFYYFFRVVPLENIRKQLLRAVVTAEFGWSLWKISKSSYYGP